MSNVAASETCREDGLGYEISRFNAVKHGILSKCTVLHWEDASEYDGLLADLVESHCPVGPIEEHLVEELAGIIWRKRRVRLAEGSAMRRKLLEVSRTPLNSQKTAKAALVSMPISPNYDVVEKALTITDTEVHEIKGDIGELCRLVLKMLDSTRMYVLVKAERGDSVAQRIAYKQLVKDLPDDLVNKWQVSLKKSAKDPQPAYTATLSSLWEWMYKEGFPRFPIHVLYGYEIREQAFGDAFMPEQMEKIARYETHLDRKLERMLAMLMKLQQVRREHESDE